MINPISSQDFIEKVKSIINTEPVTSGLIIIPEIRDYVVFGSVTFTPSNYPATVVTLTNCLFKDDVLFEGINLDNSLNIKDCGFEKKLDIYYCTSSNDRISPNLLIEGSQKIAQLYIYSNNLKGGLVIRSITIDLFSIVDLIYSKHLHFDMVTIEKSCELVRIKTDELKFNTCNINSTKVDLNDLEINECNFRYSKFTGIINLNRGRFTKSLGFQNNIFEDDITINEITAEGELRIITGNEFKKQFRVNYHYNKEEKTFEGFKELYFEGSTFLGGLKIFGSEDGRYAEVTKVTIIADSLKGRINFINLKILETKINNSNSDGYIIFKNVKFLKLEFNEFTNFSDVQFINIKSTEDPSTKLEIKDSNLGKTQFLNASLDKFSHIEIHNSILSEIIASNVNWFNFDKVNQQIGNEDKETHWKNKRELFRQLKYAMEKQGNMVQALVFKRHEMTAYREELKHKKEKNREDQFTMFVNQSNDYGQSWLLPSVLAITITFMFYCLLIILIEPESTGFVFYEYGYVFFNLFNPIHTLDKLFPNTNIPFSFPVNALDFIYKIVISYLIFQTVSAFRKHIK